MSTRCKGCYTIIKRSGLYPHFLHSCNPQCELYRCKLDDGVLLPNNEGKTAASRARAHITSTEHSESESEREVVMECQSCPDAPNTY